MLIIDKLSIKFKSFHSILHDKQNFLSVENYVISGVLDWDIIIRSILNLKEDFLETVNQLIEYHKISLTTSDQGVYYSYYRFIEIINDLELRKSMLQRGTVRIMHHRKYSLFT